MSPAALAWLRFRRHKAGLAGAVFLLLLAAAAWSAPLIEAALGIDAESVDLFSRYAPPSAAHPLGADDLGRGRLRSGPGPAGRPVEEVRGGDCAGQGGARNRLGGLRRLAGDADPERAGVGGGRAGGGGLRADGH